MTLLSQLPRLGVLAVLLGPLACGLPGATTHLAAATPAELGQVKLQLDGASLATAQAVGATLTIGPGSGPSFTPISAPLSRSSSAAWTTFVTNVPAGPRRRLEVVVYGAGGAALYAGGVVTDIHPGATSSVAIVLQGPGGGGPQVTNPLVSVGISVAAVTPGGTALLTVQATDPAGRPLASRWTASCGAFADPSQPSTSWTAPPFPNQRCQLSFTATSAVASTTVELSVDVLLDPATRSVMGRRLVTCWEDPAAASGLPVTSTFTAPDVLQAAPPDALVEASPGAWVAQPGGHVALDGSFVPGSFGADGSFYLPGLPQVGPFLLSFTDAGGVPLLVESSGSDVDLGFDRLGRCSQLSASPGTSASFQLSQLDPWSTAGSELQAASSEVDAWLSLASGAQLPQDATSAALLTAWTGPLLFGPEVLWLHQLTPLLHPSGLAYRASTRAALVGPVTLLDGGGTTLAAALAPPARAGALEVQWAAGAFERSQADLAPAGRLAPGLVPAHRLSVKALPVLSPLAPMPAAGALELASLELPAGTVSVGLASPLTWGRFLPAHWSEWREVRYAVAVGYQAPGGDTWYEESAVRRRDGLPAPAGLVGPVVTPVRAPLVNGASALLDQALPVTTTPTFSWTPPATGTPSVYRLEVFGLQASAAGRTTAAPVVRYLTGSTAATLPPGLLVPGGLYFARITALVGDLAYLSAPLHTPRVEASASALTGTFSP